MFELDGLADVPRHIQTRWASGENPTAGRGVGGQAKNGRKGAPWIDLKPNEPYTLAESSGQPGMVRRMWCSFPDRSPKMLRSLRLRMYWDGCASPAVDCPFGDFCGIGLGLTTPFECVFFSNPEGRSLNWSIPMPFRTGMKITLTYETDDPTAKSFQFFYDIDFTLGDTHNEDTSYFHAHWNRENPTTLQHDFHILPRVEGRGRYLGCNVGVRDDQSRYPMTWWGEGEVKIYLDGDTDYPTLCGTGAEDYPGSGWGFSSSVNWYQGCPIHIDKHDLTSFYRYHVQDPVFFQEDCRVTIQQLGCLGPEHAQLLIDRGLVILDPELKPIDLEKVRDEKLYVLFEREDDWSATAYFYLDRPENNLPELAPLSERLANLIDVGDSTARTDA